MTARDVCLLVSIEMKSESVALPTVGEGGIGSFEDWSLGDREFIVFSVHEGKGVVLRAENPRKVVEADEVRVITVVEAIEIASLSPGQEYRQKIIRRVQGALIPATVIFACEEGP